MEAVRRRTDFDSASHGFSMQYEHLGTYSHVITKLDWILQDRKNASFKSDPAIAVSIHGCFPLYFLIALRLPWFGLVRPPKYLSLIHLGCQISSTRLVLSYTGSLGFGFFTLSG